MRVEVNGVDAHASTGGRDHDASSDPVVIFVHGSGMDSTVWQLQSRYIAYRGFRSVAVNLPGHGRSAGSPLTTVEAMGEWLAQFCLAAELDAVHVVGHSMGTFIGLEMAAASPARVQSLTLCGTATAMPVHPDLLRDAHDDTVAAAALMAAWGHGRPAHLGVNPAPGLWMLGGARALVEQSHAGALGADLTACANYQGALVAAAAVRCPVTVVIGDGDRMTPPKGGRALAAALTDATVVELAGTGHSMMSENPRGVNAAILATVRR